MAQKSHSDSSALCMCRFETIRCFSPKQELAKEIVVGAQVLVVVRLLLVLSKSHGFLNKLKPRHPSPQRPFSTGKHLRPLTEGSFYGRHLCLAKPKVAGTLTTLRLQFRRFKPLYQTQNLRTLSQNKACSRSLARACCGRVGLRMSNNFQRPVLSSRHSSAVDPAPSGRWTLRDKAAQRRSPPRWTERSRT